MPSLSTTTRRSMLVGASAGLLARPSWAAETTNLPLPGGPTERQMTTAFPQKGPMILQRARPPMLETVHGHVNQTASFSLADILAMPRVEVAAVNQCSGNSRGFFQPRVAGGEWGHGAMGNARWAGVRVRDLLDRAGVKSGAMSVRFNGLDVPAVPNAPDFIKSLAVDHARSDDVILAYLMNGAPLPLLNGFPLRLVVPGWFATYWVKMVDDIEISDAPDANFWMAAAYRIPDTPDGAVKPGETGFKTVPINRMGPRSFITNLADGDTVTAGAPVALRGIAFGGDTGVARVEISTDQGKTWSPTTLGEDAGRYSFRRWTASIPAPPRGAMTVAVRCTNTDGTTQTSQPAWNPSGYMRNVIETVQLKTA